MFESSGKKILEEKLLSFISRGKTIKFVLPAFPCKSPNVKDKVLGVLPDKGEEVALNNLSAFCNKIKLVYSPGCELVIVSDGRVFADIVGVPDEIVSLYDFSLRELSTGSSIKFISLDDFFSLNTSDDMRQKLLQLYGKSLEEIRKEILTSEDKRKLYCGLTRFLVEDTGLVEDKSKSTVQKECKTKALSMMQRNSAYSALVKEKLPDHIRLSIHPHSNAGEKFGINLISCGDEWGTPWHNVAVKMKNGVYKLIKRREAEALGYGLVEENGRPSYFVEV